MVLAHRVELDVPQHDHVVRTRIEDGVVQHAPGRLTVTTGEERQRLGHPRRRLQQTIAFGVLAQFDEQLANQRGNLLLVRFFRLLVHGEIVYHISSEGENARPTRAPHKPRPEECCPVSGFRKAGRK